MTAKITSVTLGTTSSNPYQTINKKHYTALQVKKDLDQVASTASLKEKIKRNNFEYGSRHHAQMDHFRTVTQASYKKDTAKHERAVLDFAKKQDLRTNHFDFGGGSAKVTESIAKKNFRPSSALERRDARPLLNASAKAELRASHWGMEQKTSLPRPASQATFVTSNMINFKWVQPRAL